ncbi:MAG: hypothetical protein ACXVC6_02930 [Bacteroidia bacterium]
MKKLLLFIILSLSFNAFPQKDTISTSSSQQDSLKKRQRSYNEIGLNITSLIKQVLNLSNTNFTPLPYTVTYKFINRQNKWAFRAGMGVFMNNTSVTTTSTTTSQNNPGNPPDESGPITNKFWSTSYRAGFEYRYSVNRRIMAYAGIDLVAQNAKSTSTDIQEFNNLPNTYQFSKTTEVIKTNGFGIGPVAGIQCYIARRLSVFTEVPAYFVYTSKNDVTTSYQNVLQFGGSYQSTTDTQTQLTKTSSLAITLPVTIYLCLKF